VTPLGEYSIIRQEVGALGGSQVVPYDRSEDLCFTDFVDQECSPNFVISINQPNDPLFSEQWSLPQIKAEQGWAIRNQGVPVAVIDTGVDCTHPDINCIAEYNGITGEEGHGKAADSHGHGTHVASTLGAVTNDDFGIAGVGHGIPIAACKFMQNGTGSLAHAMACIQWASSKQVKVASNSWGCSGCYSEPMLNTIKSARDAGMLAFVCAAGNSGLNNDSSTHHYPSDYSMDGYDPIISVAALSQANKRANFSNFGPESVDLAAPGVSILAAIPGGAHQSMSGTSMATPIISGAISLLIANGDRNPRQSLLQSALPVPDFQGKTVTGGTLDLEGALRNTGAPIPTPTPDPCKRKKLKKCRQGCEREFRCEYRRNRRCRMNCYERWCDE
jgi:subtilisin family serine protease